ncbi:ATP-binding cassette sub-family A member 5-like isoform X1 [Asterias rubens]|uniref:ATP-binding cassette sub-family A member 5-like isoform X1 n=2 Tax=Asterias rubens TaxID=7604 RepID=UPI001454F435|nr:ATP-binding cassette sub-family A member 5-like isoform X1 [Asterias rubens]XP_033629987.1 ATP-binding cassette sub-family A member 5-like isoform X1 [Asterias rubens]
MASFWQQTRALLYRNFMFKRNDKMFQEFFLPCLFMASMYGISLSARPQVFNPLEYKDFQDHSLLNMSFLPNTSSPWAFAPNTPSTQAVMLSVRAYFGSGMPEFLAFDSEAELVGNFTAQEVPPFSIGVVFNNDFPQDLAVTIRMTYSSTPLTAQGERFTTEQSCRLENFPAGLNSYNCPANQYLYSGFAALQVVLQNAVASLHTNETISLPDVSVRMFPKGAFVLTSPTIRVVNSLYYIMMYLVYIGVLLSVLVYEKEKKIKETMLMMGMNNGPYWLSWFITYTSIILFVSILIAVLSKYAIQIVLKGNFLILYLIMAGYGLSIVSMAFMFTPFFNKATVAGAVGSLVTLVLSFLYIPMSLIVGTPSVVKWLLSFLSPVAMALAMDQAIGLDQLGVGIQFDNMGIDGFPPYVVMLYVDAVLYFLLAIYFDNVVPGAYGRHKPLFFCFMPSYWSRKERNAYGSSSPIDNEVVNNDEGDVELVSQEMKGRASIRIRNMKKTFKGPKNKPDIQAVRGMGLDIYEGQITCLLGHNGAGKTTLINILTGLLAPDSGQATIYGYDIRDPIQLQKVRSMVGVCSQENTLIEALSAREHLRVFAGLKGIPSENIEEEVNKILKLTLLDDVASTVSKSLSGGQKRKLCVGIALIGNPKVIFLDEPSSGMDPYSRRELWTLLKSQRHGKVTVLTTHFMDEADILADRKAMMSKGNLRCYGSSLFLKSRFGIGYHLGMVVDQDIDTDRITEIVTSHIPEGKVSRSHGMELAYTLPLKDTNRFPDLFQALEEPCKESSSQKTVAQDLGIQTYGVSMTSLEEVFLKLNEEEEAEEAQADDVLGTSDRTPINVTGTNYNSRDPVLLSVSEIITKPLEPSKYQIKAFCKLLFSQMLRDPGTYFTRVFFPVAYIIVSVILQATITFTPPINKNPDSLALVPSLYLETSEAAPMYDSLTSLLYQDNLAASENISLLVDQFEQMGIQSDTIANMSAMFSQAPHNMATVVNTLGTSSATPGFVALYNDTAMHSLPIILGLLNNALVPLQTAGQTFLNMTVFNHPFPQSSSTQSYTFNSGFFLVLLLFMAFSSPPGGFVVNIVKERQEGVRTQMRVSGVSAGSYWGCHLIIDCTQMYAIALVGVIAIVVIGLALGNSSLFTVGGLFFFIVFMLLFLPMYAMFAYCISFIFTEYQSAQSGSQLFFTWLPFVFGIPVMMVDLIGDSTIATILHFIFCFLYPPYTLFGGLYYISKVYEIAKLGAGVENITFGDYFAFDTLIIPTLLCVLVDLVIVVFLLRFLEIQNTGGNVRDTCFCSQGNVDSVLPNRDQIPDEDDDVEAERSRVKEMFEQNGQNEKCAVAAMGIRKEFTKGGGCCGGEESKVKVAVRNLTLSVNEGEVMGLLGPNGAGKTTSMNVITADTKANRGQIKIAGHDITSSLSDVYQVMGYCPQHDPLFENITMREHIETIGMIKGIHPDDAKNVAQHFMDGLEISEHADKKSQELSGGTKRKLCFAMSMLGTPKIVFLDEPSTGMDPTSKRYVWNTIIASFRKDRGAVLTTHSMEEADAVCSRVGIMVSGKLVCLGTTQHLKSKYGGGYILEVKLNPGEAYYSMDHSSGQAAQLLNQHLSALDQTIRQVFPAVEVTETFGERVTYRIPKDGVTSLSEVFKAMEDGKENLHVEEYSFSQATLEQVFIEFAKQQREEDETREGTASSSRPGSANNRINANTGEIV